MALFSAEGRALFWGLFRGNGGSFHKASVCNYTKKYGRSVKRIALVAKYLGNLDSACSHKCKNRRNNRDRRCD